MANSQPRPPIEKRANEEILEDLCLELRNVACGEGTLPLGERVLVHIREVRALQAELAKRRVNYSPRLERLSEETRWQMLTLLDDCLAYPKRIPYVREPDGIRRFLRCHLCTKAERPADAKLFWFCDTCMRRVLEAVQQRAPISGIILFRTYNVECRCAHADTDTVLAGEAQSYDDNVYGVCERCINEEIEKRGVAS
jgi:hypothetical protein